MNKGQSTIIATVITGGIMGILGWVGSMLLNAPTESANAIDTVKVSITKETLERTNADTALDGKFSSIDTKLDAIIVGLGIKYSLPKIK